MWGEITREGHMEREHGLFQSRNKQRQRQAGKILFKGEWRPEEQVLILKAGYTIVSTKACEQMHILNQTCFDSLYCGIRWKDALSINAHQWKDWVEFALGI